MRPCVDVTVFSDDAGKSLAKAEYEDFRKEYPDVSIAFKKTGGTFHDRFVVIDHGKQGERVLARGPRRKMPGVARQQPWGRRCRGLTATW